MMFDYDLGAIAKRLNAHGVNDIRLIHTDHGGHHGASAIFGSDGPAQPAWIFIVSESRPDGGWRREDTGRDLLGDSEQPDDRR